MATITANINSYKLETNRKWKEEKRIGGGGFGSVTLEKTMVGGVEEVRAVKKLSLDLYKNKGLDCKRELHALIAVQDCRDLFVQFLGWYKNKDFIFIAMEYLEYGDLGNYIKERKEEAIANTQNITNQLLKGLTILQERSICHRDLKPQNILIASHSPLQIKLADFGASKSTAESKLNTRYVSPGYSAPEMSGYLDRRFRLGREYPFALDMWAFGCIVHKILTGEIPFLDNETSSTSLVVPSGTRVDVTDERLFSVFCSGNISLPTASLIRSRVDSKAIGFIEGLLVASPKLRMSAAEALKHEWLIEPKPITTAANQADAPTMAESRSVLLSTRHDPLAREGLIPIRSIPIPERSEIGLPRPITTTIEGNSNLPQFLFRAFHTGGSHNNPFRGFRAGRPGNAHTSDVSRLRKHFSPSDSTASVLTTCELLQAINMAINLQEGGNKGVSIAIIDVEACSDSRQISLDSNPNQFKLSPRMLRTSIIKCLSLDTLVQDGLYTVVPELDPKYQGEESDEDSSDEESDESWEYSKMRIQVLRMMIEKSQWKWETRNRLKYIGNKAAKVAQCFGFGTYTYFICIEVAEWWDSWWQGGVIDEEIVRIWGRGRLVGQHVIES